MARVPENKRLRSHVMGGTAVLATTVDQDIVLDTYTFLDDVKVVGISVSPEFNVLDAHSNADGQYNAIVEISRSGKRAQAGTMAWCTMHKVWNAAITIGGEDNRKDMIFMFPDGCGWEFDEGESVNMLAFLEWVGGGGDLAFYANATLYYVER